MLKHAGDIFYALLIFGICFISILTIISSLKNSDSNSSTQAANVTVEESLIPLAEFDGSDVYIWTDPETGVQYVVYSEKHGYAGIGGITPRLQADGSLYINEVAGG